MQAWIIRPANIIGPNLTHGVLFDFIMKLRQNSANLEILGDGRQSKSYIYVSDVIEAMFLILEKAKRDINIFNLSSDTFITVNEIAKIIIREMNLKKVNIFYRGGKIGWKGDIAKVRIDNSRLKKLGWREHYSSRGVVLKTVRVLLGKEK